MNAPASALHFLLTGCVAGGGGDDGAFLIENGFALFVGPECPSVCDHSLRMNAS